MKTGDKNIGHAREIIYPFRANRDDLAKPGTHGQVVLCFAMGFTTETPDTALDIMVYIICAHKKTPFQGLLNGFLHLYIAFQQGVCTACRIKDI